MKINKLRLRNFKGIQNFELNFNGEDASLFGDNATGKTTIFDAFNWLLFEKDSLNRKDFGIKTLEKNGEAIHGLEHEVIGEFTEPDLVLRKVYKEKWTKQRGSSEAVFTGNTVDYYVNDIPSKKTEYTAKVEEVVREDVFKLLSNPLFFNTQLHWQERRKLLFKVCGDVTDEEVINKKDGLKELGVILFDKKRSLDDHKKLIASKLKEINQEIDKIPTRIDEVKRSMEDVSNLKIEDIKGAIETLELNKKQKQDELLLLENGGQAVQIKKQISEVETEMHKIKNKFEQAKADAKLVQYKKFSEISKSCSDKKLEANEIENTITACNSFISRHETEVMELRERVKKISLEEHIVDCACPTCGQSLPEDQVNDTISKINLDKSNRMERIRAEGKTLVGQIEGKKKLLSEKVTKLAILKTELEALEKKKSSSEYTFEDDRKIEDEPEYKKLGETLAAYHAIPADDSIAVQVKEIKDKINTLNDEIKNFTDIISKIEASKKSEARIEELRQQERKLSAEHQDYSKQQYLCEEFIRAKVDMITEKINSKFKIARFKLFNDQINGGLEEACEVMVDGVPYSDLNNAMRINSGIDIINTLSKHYNVTVPVFADNAESVTEMEKTEGQLIRLIVDERFKKLTLNPEILEFAKYKIDEQEQHDLAKLRALQAAGVDNWMGYDVAMSTLNNNNEEEEV